MSRNGTPCQGIIDTTYQQEEYDEPDGVAEDGSPKTRKATRKKAIPVRCGFTLTPDEPNCPNCVAFHTPASRQAREAHSIATARMRAIADGLTNPDRIPKRQEIQIPAPPEIQKEHPGAMLSVTVSREAEHNAAARAMEAHIHEQEPTAEHERPKEAHLREQESANEIAERQARFALILAEREAARTKLIAEVAEKLAKEPAQATALVKAHGADVVTAAFESLGA